jgi:hypothetical protein
LRGGMDRLMADLAGCPDWPVACIPVANRHRGADYLSAVVGLAEETMCPTPIDAC